MQTSCPEVTTLADFASGRLASVDVARVERHIDSCARCAGLLPAGLSSAAKYVAAVDRDERLIPGTLLGRHEVRRWIGRGAMGDVYEGFDPQLERKVALKLLRTTVADDEEARERLGREARAMARLSHPHVVTLLDIGLHQSRAFLVMELVDGTTLQAWLRERRRTSREILEVFLAAGEGLAAAHAIGIVHRDFKPQNVLVGHDGQVRVTDFGLARWAEAPEPPLAEDESPGSHDERSHGQTTATGRRLGTPRYMSPEQFRGTPADERTDQFSFCVALCEALTGEHPFAGPLVGAGRGAGAGALGETPRLHGLPRSISRALLRGMKRSPADRYPSMEPLLRALASHASIARRIRIGVPVAAAILIAVGSIVASLVARSRVAPPVVRLVGKPADLSAARVVGQFNERIHCLAVVRRGAIRAILGTPRRAEDIDLETGRRQPSALVPETYRNGCPEPSPDGRELIFEGFDANGRAHIFHAPNSVGTDALPVVSSAEPSVASEPQWLSSGREFVFDLDFWHAAVFSLQNNTTTVIPRPDRKAGPGLLKAVEQATDRIVVFYQQPGSDKNQAEVYRWPSLLVENRFEAPTGVARWRFGLRQSIAYGTGLDRESTEWVISSIGIDSGVMARFGAIAGRGLVDLVPLDQDSFVLATRTVTDRIWFSDKDGNDRIIDLSAGILGGSPDVASDGTVIYITESTSKANVVRYDPDKRTSHVLEAAGDSPVDVDVLPTGELILTRIGHAAGIHRCSRTGASCRSLHRGHTFRVAVSLDGEWLAFVAGAAQGLVVSLLSSDGTSERLLVSGVTTCEPIWSGPHTIWVSRRERGILTWVELDVGLSVANWSPNARPKRLLHGDTRPRPADSWTRLGGDQVYVRNQGLFRPPPLTQRGGATGKVVVTLPPAGSSASRRSHRS
jgi:tRNA A-37 threonylcarbamoyl transferase component Bud32